VGGDGRTILLLEVTLVMGRMGETKGAYRVLVGKPEGKRPLGSHRCRLEDNIKMDFQEMGERGLILLWIETNGGLL
jgi:hypothetical protein